MIISDDTFEQIFKSIDKDHMDHGRMTMFFQKDLDGWRFLDCYCSQPWYGRTPTGELSLEEITLKKKHLCNLRKSIIYIIDESNSNIHFIKEERSKFKLYWVIEKYNSGCAFLDLNIHFSYDIRTVAGVKIVDIHDNKN